MTKESATHSQATDFDGPVATGDAQANRKADKKGVGQPSADTSVAAKVETFPSGKVAEQFTAMLGNVEGLSEDFTNRAAVIIEGAVSEQFEILKESFEAHYQTQLAEAVEASEALMEEKLDGYLNYVTETFMKENELAIVGGIKLDISEQVITAMVNIVEEAGVTIPESEVDAVAEVVAENDRIEADLNNVLQENINLRSELRSLQESRKFEELTEGLTDVAKDRLKRLVENASYNSLDEYEAKLNILKESVTGIAPAEAATDLTEATESVKPVVTEKPVLSESEARQDAYKRALRGEY